MTDRKTLGLHEPSDQAPAITQKDLGRNVPATSLHRSAR